MWSDVIFVYISLCVLPVLLPDTHWVRYYACYVSYILLSSFFALLYIPVYFLKGMDPHDPWVPNLGVKVTSKMLNLFLEVRGPQMEKTGRGVIVLNHQSILDALPALSIAKHYGMCIGVSRKEIFYFWPFGLALYLSNFIFIDRNNGKLAVKSLLEGAESHMKKHQNGKVFIFPEGTRNKIGDNFLPFKKGSFRLAIDQQVPIFPAVISPYYFISEKSYFTKGKMIISLLEPIATKGMTDLDLDQLMDMTRKSMIYEYLRLSDEVKLYENN